MREPRTSLRHSISALRRGLSLSSERLGVLTRQRQALVPIRFDHREASTEERVLILHGHASDKLASESFAGELAPLVLVAIARVEVSLLVRDVSQACMLLSKLPELACLRK
jgi:hypothetical protein